MVVFYVHKGCQSYLAISIAQTRCVLPDAEIILIGDASNRLCRLQGITHLHIDSFCDEKKWLDRHYKHSSVNDPDFEKFCLLRHFVANKAACEMGVSRFLLLDSDVLIFAPIVQVANAGEHLVLSCSENGTVSPHCSFWPISASDSLVEAIKNAYLGPKSELLERYSVTIPSTHFANKTGGDVRHVSDMDFCRELFRTYAGAKASCFQHCHIDHALHVSDGFEVRDGIKWISFDANSIPVAASKSGRKVPLAAIHFQGSCKPLISKFYTGNAFSRYVGCSALKIHKAMDYFSLIHMRRRLRNYLGVFKGP